MRGAAMLAALLHFALALVPCAAIDGRAIHGPAVEQHTGAGFQHDDSLCAICTAHHSASAPSGRIIPWIGAPERITLPPATAHVAVVGTTLRPSTRAPPGLA